MDTIPEKVGVVYSDGTPTQITFTWKIKSLNTKRENGYDNAVVQTYWNIIGTDSQGKVAAFDGATPFNTVANQSNFIEFQNLQESDVLSWITSQVTGSYAEHIMDQIYKKLDVQYNQVVDATLPWAPPPTDSENP
jgi:hypothetical protein